MMSCSSTWSTLSAKVSGKSATSSGPPVAGQGYGYALLHRWNRRLRKDVGRSSARDPSDPSCTIITITSTITTIWAMEMSELKGAERWTTVPRVAMSTALGVLSCYLSLSLSRTPSVGLWAPAVQNLCIVFIRLRATSSRCAAAPHLLPRCSMHIRETQCHLQLQYIRTTPRYSHLWP